MDPLTRLTSDGSTEAFDIIGSKSFSDATMKSRVSEATYSEFKASIVSGAALSDDSKKEIATAMKDWAVEMGAINFAHMFTPIRVGDGRSQSAYKIDGFMDLDFGSPEVLKPVIGNVFGKDRLFQSETDGWVPQPMPWPMRSMCPLIHTPLHIHARTPYHAVPTRPFISVLQLHRV